MANAELYKIGSSNLALTLSESGYNLLLIDIYLIFMVSVFDSSILFLDKICPHYLCQCNIQYPI